MKTTLQTVVSFVLTAFVIGPAFSQIQLLSSDLTAIGDQIVRYQDTIPTYGPGGSGPGQVWDFSSAVVDVTTTTNVVTTASTPYSSTFSGSSYAMTNGVGAYLYFTHNANTQSTTGAAGDLLGTGEIITAPFTNPLTLHNFPRTYGSHFNDSYAFQAEANGAAFNVYRVRVTHTGNVFDTTDAYGTLITPTGTYDVLRVKTVDYTTDVIEAKLASFLPWTPFTTIYDTSTTYSWHSKLEKLAIADFSYDSIGNPRQFTYSSVPPVVTTGIAGSDSETFSIYPTLASDKIWIKGIDMNGTFPIAQVYGLDGKMIRNEQLTENSLNLQGITSGIYFLRLLLEDGTESLPMKFFVE